MVDKVEEVLDGLGGYKRLRLPLAPPREMPEGQLFTDFIELWVGPSGDVHFEIYTEKIGRDGKVARRDACRVNMDIFRKAIAELERQLKPPLTSEFLREWKEKHLNQFGKHIMIGDSDVDADTIIQSIPQIPPFPNTGQPPPEFPGNTIANVT